MGRKKEEKLENEKKKKDKINKGKDKEGRKQI